MTLNTKIFRWVVHRMFEQHPCHSLTWWYKGYKYTVYREVDE